MQPQNEPAPAPPEQPAPDTVIAPTTPPPEPAIPETPAPSPVPPPAAPQVESAPSQPPPTPAPPAPMVKPDQQPPQTAAKPAMPTPKSQVPNTLPVTEPGEHTVCVIKRHPIGILGTYVAAVVILIVAAGFSFIVIPDFISDKSQATAAGGLLFVVVALICAVFILAARKVYWGNSWTVTSDSLTQVRRSGLFDRQSSQLSLKDLEDVTAAQNGILPRMFNYGLLKVETAGERSKFIFPFCPNPNYYAQQILTAREAFERNRAAEESPEQKTP